MKLLLIIILFYSFLKTFYYVIYEIKEKKNQSGGIAIIFIAILGLILPIFWLFYIY